MLERTGYSQNNQGNISTKRIRKNKRKIEETDIIRKNIFWSKLSKLGKSLFFTVAYTVLILYYLWCIPAVYFLNLPWEWLRILLSLSFALAIPAALIIFRKKKRSLWYIAGVCIFFGTWFSLIPALNDRNWATPVAKLPAVQFAGDKVTIKNIRNFTYRSENDYIPGYYTETYDLKLLDSIDYILSYWDGNTKVAHTLLSFGFKDGRYLCVSVETRCEKNEPQTPIRGIYNQYELIYVLADESDILLLRTNYRKEEVFVYPLKPRIEGDKRKLFVQILKEVVEIRKHPKFYNTVKHNCLTSLLNDVSRATGRATIFDYRMIMNGLSDKMGYERGWFDTRGLCFEDFKKIHHINQYVKDDPNAKINFSKKIRPKIKQATGSNKYNI